MKPGMYVTKIEWKLTPLENSLAGCKNITEAKTIFI